jgi:serine/threonine protein kinase
MSPEQARGLEPDYRTDIFSLGIVLYEHLCGGHPFGALPGRNDVSVIVAIREERPVYPNEINQDVCPELAVVCWRALEKGLSNRFQSCQEFKEALQRALEAQKRYERGFFHKVWDTLRGR